MQLIKGVYYIKKFTLRLSNESAEELSQFKTFLKLRNQKLSYNKIINNLVNSGIPKIRISQKDIDKINSIKTSKQFKTCSKNLANVNNSINSLRLQIKGKNNNINQISKNLNFCRKYNILNEFSYINLDNSLNQLKSSETREIKEINKIDKEVANIWKSI